MVSLYYLVYSNGSRLFREPVPEDFAYHCLLLSIDKDLGLTAVKAPALMELYFFLLSFAELRLNSPFLSACDKLLPGTVFRSGTGGFAGVPTSIFNTRLDPRAF